MKEKTFKGFIAKNIDLNNLKSDYLDYIVQDFVTDAGTIDQWYPEEWPPCKCEITIRWEE